jgi:hypothetical protein
MIAYTSGRKRGFNAICQGITRRLYPGGNRRMQTLPVFAEILFHRKCLTTRYIVHECFHAALMYGRRLGYKMSALDDYQRNGVSLGDVEERLAYAHDQMCSTLVTRLYKLKLIV